eukprot:gene9719-9878_t
MGDNSVWKAMKPFVNGGLSGMAATCIIQPIDMVKVRLQLGATGGPVSVAKEIIAKDGFGALYKGLSAGLLRQATYTTARLGIFSQISEYAKQANGGKNLPLWQKAACGLTAGGLGALVGTPADLTLIRMQVVPFMRMLDSVVIQRSDGSVARAADAEGGAAGGAAVEGSVLLGL